MDAYAESVGFSGPEPSQIQICTPKENFEPIKAAIKKRRLRWLGHVSRTALNRIKQLLVGLLKAKENKADLKPPDGEQSRKRLRQWI